MPVKKVYKKTLLYIKALFLSGLFTILPIILTVFIITFTYGFIYKWIAPIRTVLPLYLQKIPASEFIIATIALLLIGLLMKSFLISPIVHWFENLITKIPLIRTIYSSSKRLVDFFNVPEDANKYRKVVMVQFPHKGIYSIGFLLEPATNNFQKLIPKEMQKTDQTYFKVFMPNSPSPATGYFLILPEEEIINTNLSFDEAIKAVVSCGLITPDSLKK